MSIERPLQQPIKPSDRIVAIDVLRGVVLCAILLMNVELFTTSLRDIDGGVSSSLHGLSWCADAFVYILLHGKGWALFSMLFGVGFAVMRKQALLHGKRLTRVWLRRAAVLLLIGTAHALLIWPGDILTSYAMAAVVLLAFRNVSAKHGAIAGLALLALPLTIIIGDAGAAMMQPASMAHDAAIEAGHRGAEIAAYAHGSYTQATAMRAQFFIETFRGRVQFLPLILGMALLGAAMFDSGVLTRPAQHRRLLHRLALAGLAAGAAITAASLALDADPQFIGVAVAGRTYMASALHLLGAPFLAVGYAAAILLGTLHQRLDRVLAPLAPAGRLALTNYLLQSIAGTLLFYGYGFGLWGELSRFGQCLFAVMLFAAQVRASAWYVQRYRYGPAEWLWRWGTYGKRPRLLVMQEAGLQGESVRRGHGMAAHTSVMSQQSGA